METDDRRTEITNVAMFKTVNYNVRQGDLTLPEFVLDFVTIE